MVIYHIEQLEERYGSLKLLLILYEFGEMYFNEITDKGITDSTLEKSNEVLKDLGLIERFKKKGEHHKRIYQRLTPVGEAIAKHLKAIEEIMEEEKRETN